MYLFLDLRVCLYSFLSTRSSERFTTALGLWNRQFVGMGIFSWFDDYSTKLFHDCTGNFYAPCDRGNPNCILIRSCGLLLYCGPNVDGLHSDQWAWGSRLVDLVLFVLFWSLLHRLFILDQQSSVPPSGCYAPDHLWYWISKNIVERRSNGSCTCRYGFLVLWFAQADDMTLRIWTFHERAWFSIRRRRDTMLWHSCSMVLANVASYGGRTSSEFSEIFAANI